MSRDYISKTPNPHGFYTYSKEENAVWGQLVDRQLTCLNGRICNTFLEGLRQMDLAPNKVPQVMEIDKTLQGITGFGVSGVPAIIPPTQFFALLADRKFPVATFLRRRDQMDYIEEPDIFHEVFGHCPLLTQPDYCDFVQGFGKLAVSLDKAYRWHMFRLLWFTVEFGLIDTPDGLRGYGAGIASSPAEAVHALEGPARRQEFDLLRVLRTPYRIDILQPIYFVIKDFGQLAEFLDQDIKTAIVQARKLGDLPAQFDDVA